MRDVAVSTALLVGCYHPSAATDVPCGAEGACPNRQMCDYSAVPPTCRGPGSPDAAPLPELCGDTSGLVAGAPWPLVHGCPTNSGRSAFAGPATNGTAVAPTGANHNRRGAVIGPGGLIVIQETGTGLISSFDGATGTPGWTFSGANGTGAEPFPVLADGNLVFATTNYGKLFVVDSVAGTLAWSLQLGGAFSAPMMGEPGTIYYGSVAPYGFYAVDTVMHKQKWHFDVPNGGDARTAAALGNGLVYFVDTLDSVLYALDPATGTPTFSVAVPGKAVGSPVLGVRAVYVATSTNGIAAFDALTGALQWQEPTNVSVVQPALVATGDVVSSTIDGNAFVLDRSTGDKVSAMLLGGKVLAPPTVDIDDTIFFGTDHGAVAYAATGELRWQSALTGPIVSGEKLLVVLPPTNTLAVIGP